MVNLKKILVYLFVFFFVFQTSIERMFSFGFIGYLDELFVFFVLMIAIIKVISNKEISNKSCKILFFLITFTFSGIIPFLINTSNSDFKSILEAALLSTKFLLIVFSFSVIGVNKKTESYLIKAIDLCAVLVMIVAVFNVLFPYQYEKIFKFAIVSHSNTITPVTSLFYHPGRYGWFMLFAGLMHFSMFKTNKSKKDIKYFIIYCIFALLSIRAKVMLSLMIIIIFELIVEKKIKLRYIVTSLIAVSVIFVVFNEKITYTYQRYFSDQYYGVSARQALLEGSTHIVEDYFPLGVGFGMYGSWYARINYSPYYDKYNISNIYGLRKEDEATFATDTYWPSIFGETGVLGSIILIYLLISLIKIFYKYNKVNKKSFITIFGLLALVQSICESFGEPSFNSAPQYLIVGILVGMAVYCVSNNKVNKNEGGFYENKNFNKVS